MENCEFLSLLFISPNSFKLSNFPELVLHSSVLRIVIVRHLSIIAVRIGLLVCFFTLGFHLHNRTTYCFVQDKLGVQPSYLMLSLLFLKTPFILFLSLLDCIANISSYIHRLPQHSIMMCT